MIITIDGPVASGKSSVAQQLARNLGFCYVYTGLLYRAAAYVITQAGIRVSHPFSPTPEILSLFKNISYVYNNQRPQILYNKQDITAQLYNHEIAQAASIVSASQQVRTALLPVQQKLAQHYSLVADGRDCGTIIYPQADCKFYLTADQLVRAKRLLNDPKRKAAHITLDFIMRELQERDRRDQTRTVAPLQVPADAIVIDNSEITQQETITLLSQHIARVYRKKHAQETQVHAPKAFIA